ncbi:SRPBCC family protein [Motilibacter aurantiacus]|uniref:SRPBCC family protein n=1 Tax=Motilibacter aurantiacus TaxID=2714955 RepID=UPI0014074CFB|nr:SRPBCC family protein [Motilibacter aurantiacus]NHC45588.1 SRPBCC family protein [Motilibacter aurantiacus]
MSTTVEKSIEVAVPIRTAYNAWTRFEDFPQFMGGVTSVQQLDDRRLSWVAEIAGVKREWQAEILQQLPDEKVAWAATEGATNAGQVTFTPIGPAKTRVTLHLEYEPEGLIEAVGDKLNIVERQAVSDLEKFKSYIEEKGASEGWRGSVNETMDVGDVGIDAAADTQGDSGKAGVSAKAVITGAAAVVGAGVAAAAAAKKTGGEDAPAAAPVEPVGEVTVVPAEPAPPVGDLVEPVEPPPLVTGEDFRTAP